MRAIPQPAAQETTEGDPIPPVNNNHCNVATTRSLIPLVVINQGSLTALRKSIPIPKTNPSEVLGTDGEEVKCRLRIVRAMTDVVDVESELELELGVMRVMGKGLVGWNEGEKKEEFHRHHTLVRKYYHRDRFHFMKSIIPMASGQTSTLAQ